MQTVDSSEVTAIPSRWRTPAIWIAVVLTWLPVTALCENLQHDLTDQPPVTPRWLVVVGGALTIPPLTVLNSAIQVRLQRLARQRRIQHTHLLTVSVHAALAAAFMLVAIDGRGWLGAIAVPGAMWQSWLLVFLAGRRPGRRPGRSTRGGGHVRQSHGDERTRPGL
jgi:hypothetical protein